MKAKHRCYKLSPQKLKEIRKSFEDYGWKIKWISVFYRIYHSTIHYHVRSKGWVRKVKVKTVLPAKVAKVYSKAKKTKYLHITYRDTKQTKKKLVEGSYEYIRNLAEQQRHKNCQHIRWIKRCSFCGKILESDSINHQQI